MSNLKTLTLRDVCQATQGVQIPKSSQSKIPKKNFKRYFYISDFTHDKNLKYVEDKYPKKNFTCEDIIVSNTGSHGEVFIGKEGILSNNLFKVTFDKEIINGSFLVLFLKSNLFKDFQLKRVKGTANPHMGHENFLDTPIILPPLPVQQKIVAKLDKIFAEIDKTIVLTEAKTKNLQNFFNSYFFFLKTKNYTNWKKKKIGQLCNLMTGGTPSTKEKKYYQNGNIPWLVSGDIHLDIISDCNGRITELGLKNSNAKFLPINSVMIALNGQGKTRGTVAILKTKATCNQSLVSIMPKDLNEIKSEIIYYILKSRYNEIRKLTGDSGNDRRGLNMPIIRKIEISYPTSLSEQNKIIKSSNLILSKLKKINEINLIKINELQLLKNSILKKAFNGELVKAA